VAPGTTIYLRPGTYLQSVVVHTPDIALVGIGRHKPVIADPAGAGDGADNGIRVMEAGDRFQPGKGSPKGRAARCPSCGYASGTEPALG
jgi:hypothetical protein